jgi:hypothetical protein
VRPSTSASDPVWTVPEPPCDFTALIHFIAQGALDGLLPRLADHDLMAVLPCRTEEYGSFEYGGLPVTNPVHAKVLV